MNTWKSKVAVAFALVVLVGACVDLDVTNSNEPDRNRALSTGQDVEALVAGTFRTWWTLEQGRAPGPSLGAAADTHSSSAANYGASDYSFEPRIPVFNIPDYRWGYAVEDSWFALNRALAAIRDAVLAVSDGVRIGDGGSDEPRFNAFARFMQGLAHAHLALLHDKALVLDETVADPTTAEFQPYGEVMLAARGYLAEARQIAAENDFSLPDAWMAQAYTSQDLIRLAHSFEARFMVQVARSPEERAAVDWSEVLSHIDQGITQDFGVQITGGGQWDFEWKDMASGGPADIAFIGPADVSGEYQRWEALPPDQKLPILITTPDRRVTGETPTSNGTLIYYDSNLSGDPERGLWFLTNYESQHYQALGDENQGFAPEMTVLEMDLLRAEAYIRLGTPELALPIINASRATGELPDATLDGVVGQVDCVPRTIEGACGDLMRALMWEKQLRLAYLYAGHNFYDDRGWGTLRTGTAIHLPIPARELQTLDMPVYTFGGVGGVDAAP